MEKRHLPRKTKEASNGTARVDWLPTFRASRRSSARREASSLLRSPSLVHLALESLSMPLSWPSITIFLTSTRSRSFMTSKTGTQPRKRSILQGRQRKKNKRKFRKRRKLRGSKMRLRPKPKRKLVLQRKRQPQQRNLEMKVQEARNLEHLKSQAKATNQAALMPMQLLQQRLIDQVHQIHVRNYTRRNLPRLMLMRPTLTMSSKNLISRRRSTSTTKKIQKRRRFQARCSVRPSDGA